MTVSEDSMVIDEAGALKGIEITCPGISLEDTLTFLENSPANPEIKKILKAIRGINGPKINDLLNSFHPKTFEEVIWLYKTTSALFLLKDDLTDPVEKMYFLESAFRVNIGSYNENPTYLHLICKSLWDIAKNDQNIIQLCKKLCTISCIGFSVSVCLVWAAIFRFFHHPVKMFRFHYFHKLAEMLASKDISFLKQNLNETYILLQLVSFLQNAIIVKIPNENIPIRFKNYFTYKKEDLELLKNWCFQVRQMFDFNMNNEVDINSGYTLIYELIELDILYRLEFSLHE